MLCPTLLYPAVPCLTQGGSAPLHLQVLPAVVGVLCPPPDGQLLVLIKPQFEAGQAQVCYGGVVRDPKVGFKACGPRVKG